MLRSGIARAKVFLVFWGVPILFSIVVVLIYISTNSVGGFLFLHILANICCCLFLMIVFLTGMKWNINVVFDLYFLYGKGC
jgi:hypothetical protein